MWLFFSLAVLARLLFFYVLLMQSDQKSVMPIPHLDGYYEIAENLLLGNGFSHAVQPPFIPGSVRTPFYPLFLAAFVLIFKNYYIALFAQIILGGLIPLLAYRISLQLLPAWKRTANSIALLLAFEPLNILLATILISETLFTVLLLAGVTFFLDYIQEQKMATLAYATGFFAFATLTRPTIQFLPFLLIGIVFLLLKRSRQAGLHSLIMGGIFFLIIAPWCIRNLIRFGNPSLSVQYASVPFGYLIPSVLAAEKHIGFEQAKREFYIGEGNITSVEDITLTNAEEYKKRIFPIIREHPMGILKSVITTFLTFFSHDGYMDVLQQLKISPSLQMDRPALTLFLESPVKTLNFIVPLLTSPILFVIFGRIAWILISLCFFYGAFRYIKIPEYRTRGIFISLLIAYFALTTIAVGLAVNARFRMPVDALILIFAVYGAYGIGSKAKVLLNKAEKTD